MKTVKFGISGLGDLGAMHAMQLVEEVRGAELVSACSGSGSKKQFAKETLGVKEYVSDFDELLKTDIDAVVIVSPSDQHALQIEKALKAGKHVFVEKPIGITMEECLRVEEAVKASDKKFMVGFMRRFDPSYSYAKAKIDAGAIGEPYMVKTVSVDPIERIPFCMKFSATNGGMLIGFGVHDTDLINWFLGANAVSVYATGSCFAFPELRRFNDLEVACGIIEYEQGKMAMLHMGRTAAHGYHIETEVIGTEGSIRISPEPQQNLAMLYNTNGIVKECYRNHKERFYEAFRIEKQAFTDCILNDHASPVTISDGLKAFRAASALRDAQQSKSLVYLK